MIRKTAGFESLKISVVPPSLRPGRTTLRDARTGLRRAPLQRLAFGGQLPPVAKGLAETTVVLEPEPCAPGAPEVPVDPDPGPPVPGPPGWFPGADPEPPVDVELPPVVPSKLPVERG